MRKYHTLPAFVVLLAAVVLWIANVLPQIVPLCLFGLAAFLFIFLSRGNLYFGKAVKIIRAGKVQEYPKAVEYFSKALKAGIPDSYAIVAASILLQNGKVDEAKDVLEPLTSSNDKKIAEEASITLSMYYWFKNDLDKAIELCEKSREAGSIDKNMYVNLCTYYLKAGKIKEFKGTVKEACAKHPLTAAMVDFKAIYCILGGNWKEAGTLIRALLAEASPSFADPFIHMAMVHLHYGNVKDAVKNVQTSLATKFSATAIYKKEDIERLLAALTSDKTSRSAVESVNSHSLDMINGVIPEWTEDENGKYEDQLPGYPEEPEFATLSPDTSVVEDEKDDDDVNTELTEEDEKWLKKHS